MLDDFIAWFSVYANVKILSMFILLTTFIAILVYVYGSKKRSKRLEEYRNIPFMDDDDERVPTSKKEGEK